MPVGSVISRSALVHHESKIVRRIGLMRWIRYPRVAQIDRVSRIHRVDFRLAV